MTEAFASIAQGILASAAPEGGKSGGVAPASLELVFAAALFAPAAGRMVDAPPWPAERAVARTTLLVIAPTCPARTVCCHVAASLGAGGAVHLALFEPPGPLLMVLVAVLSEHLPSRFTLVSDGGGWHASAAETEIVVVTARDAFVNDAPWVRVRSDATVASSPALTAFYAAASGGGTIGTASPSTPGRP